MCRERGASAHARLTAKQSTPPCEKLFRMPISRIRETTEGRLLRRARVRTPPDAAVAAAATACETTGVSQPGPRDYTAGTERALYAFSAATCYFPDCPTRVVVFVNGEPVSNVEIAHIRGANPGSPRYDPAMTNDERRSFTNLILLCRPHHNVVDRLRPANYSVELLTGWKNDHERLAGIDGDALSFLTDDRLVDLIEKAVAAAGPRRLIAVELGLGIAGRRQLIVLPRDTAKDFFDTYAHLGPPVLAVTARSQGALKAFVDGHAIRFTPVGAAITGTNDFPAINPPLPCPVDIGESATWMYRLDNIITMVKFWRSQDRTVDALVGEASLGSGETIASAPLPVALLGGGS